MKGKKPSKIFYIETGKLSKEETEKIVEKIRKKFKKKLCIKQDFH
jgi:hypothetical protein